MKLPRRIMTAAVAAALGTAIAAAQAPVPGTWTRVATNPASPVAHMLLLTDGSVLVNSFFFSNHVDSWYRLVPDSTGSYVNGTWLAAGSLQAGYNPLYFASAIQKNGGVAVYGGEYNNGGAVWTNKGAFFNPKTSTWTALTAPPGFNNIGDAQSIVLPNGNYFLANALNTQQSIGTPAGAGFTWATTGTGKLDSNNEEGWTLLPNGKVLTVDCNNNANPSTYELYDPATGAWSFGGSTVVRLVEPSSHEIGPAVLRPDGTVFVAGATLNNAVYNSNTNIWAAAPPFGGGLDIADGPAAVLPNGNVLFDTSPGVFQNGAVFFEWDGTSMNLVPGPPNAPNTPSYQGNFVVLPTGQIIYTDFSNDVEIYTPFGSPCAGCAPVVTSVATTLTHGVSGNILSGTQLNGLTVGAEYGDDAQSASNYPLVRIIDSLGKVNYCRTRSFTSMGVATGNAVVSCKFDIPSTVALGAATLEVVTNGIPSAPVAVTIN